MFNCRQHEDFAVSHPSGSGRSGDPFHDLRHPGIVYPELDFNLGEKGLRILALAVLVEVALLPSKSLHLLHTAGLEGRKLERLEHPLGQEGLHIGNHFLHGGEPYPESSPAETARD